MAVENVCGSRAVSASFVPAAAALPRDAPAASVSQKRYDDAPPPPGAAPNFELSSSSCEAERRKRSSQSPQAGAPAINLVRARRAEREGHITSEHPVTSTHVKVPPVAELPLFPALHIHHHAPCGVVQRPEVLPVGVPRRLRELEHAALEREEHGAAPGVRVADHLRTAATARSARCVAVRLADGCTLPLAASGRGRGLGFGGPGVAGSARTSREKRSGLPSWSARNAGYDSSGSCGARAAGQSTERRRFSDGGHGITQDTRENTTGKEVSSAAAAAAVPRLQVEPFPERPSDKRVHCQRGVAGGESQAGPGSGGYEGREGRARRRGSAESWSLSTVTILTARRKNSAVAGQFPAPVQVLPGPLARLEQQHVWVRRVRARNRLLRRARERSLFPRGEILRILAR